MNIALLILGVFVILLSTILIIINTSDSENKNIDHVTEDRSDEKVSEYTEDIPKKNDISNQILEIQKENVEIEEKIDLEDEILYKDFSKINSEVYNSNQETLSKTDQIIKMYKIDGLEVNEIAKKLKKGIREIEIILKVNNIKE